MTEWMEVDGKWTDGNGTAIRFSIEHITPKIAAKWLEDNDANFRDMRERHANRLAGFMKSGWSLNGVPIIFDKEGKLRDGQHRLRACIVSATAFDTVVVRGVDELADLTVDRGQKRNVSDWLKYRGEKNVMVLAGVLGFLSRWERKMYCVSDSPPLDVAIKLLEKNPTVRNSITFITSYCNKAPMSKVVGAGLHYIISQKYPAVADKFFKLISTGLVSNESDPIYRLRAVLKDADPTPRQHVACALTITAWNLWIAGKTTRAIFWREVGPTAMPFPELRMDDVPQMA